MALYAFPSKTWSLVLVWWCWWWSWLSWNREQETHVHSECMGCICLMHSTYPLGHQGVKTWSCLVNNIGLWLSKNTKNSPLSIILLTLGLSESWQLGTKNFQPKKVEISNFELYKCYIPQKKAENVYNSDSGRKSTISSKKKFFFRFFQFLRHCRGCQKFSNVQFFEKVLKNSNYGFTGNWQMLRGSKSWSESKFGATSREPHEIT